MAASSAPSATSRSRPFLPASRAASARPLTNEPGSSPAHVRSFPLSTGLSVMSTRSLATLLLWLILAAAAGAPVAVAQTPQPPAQAGSTAGPAKQPDGSVPALPGNVAATLSKAAASLADVEKALQHLSEMEGDLADLRAKVEQVLEATTAAADALRPQLADIKSQIEKLGPAPGKDAPAEAPDMAAERARLVALAGAYDGAIKSSELTWVRARQMIERITELRHALFAKDLMERLPSPLTPGAWREIASNASTVHYQFTAWSEHWWNQARAKERELGMLAAAVIGIYLLLKIVFRRATNRRGRRAEPPLPTFFERAVSAVW